MSNELRRDNLRRLRDSEFDVLIVGGGINGAVAAASLAGRGVKTALIEREDFAAGTSSSSSNLIWGGIKYLETYEFRLVNKLCRSRNRLMRAYPSTVREIRFLTSIQRGFRHWPFMVFLGSLLYWFMGRFATRPPRFLTAAAIERAEPVIDTGNTAGGLEYSDCYLQDNDARFVFDFVRRALDAGCAAANYVESLGAEFDGDRWLCRARDGETGETFSIRARALVNACGPWVDRHNGLTGQQTTYRHVFSKGIHLIVDRITDSRRVLAFFASDGRLFFLIPMGPKTCVGTTDTQVSRPEVEVTEEDREFVLDNINALLDLDPPLGRGDIVAERVGVRPLAVTGDAGDADWVQLSRKHVIECDRQRRHLSIFGGKLTDCLNVGDEVAEQVAGFGIPVPHPDERWYGEPGPRERDEFLRRAEELDLDSLTDPSSPEPLTQRFWRRYGRRAFTLLDRVREDRSCARLLIGGAEYTRCELELAAESEMIVRLEDFMRRRSTIELVTRREDIAAAEGLREVCGILFGERAGERLSEYLDSVGGPAGAGAPSSGIAGSRDAGRHA